MLAQADKVVRSHGYAVGNVDATIVAQEPKLAPHIAAMRQAVASTLAVEVERVSIKATTSDGMGFTGRGEGIAAFADSVARVDDNDPAADSAGRSKRCVTFRICDP